MVTRTDRWVKTDTYGSKIAHIPVHAPHTVKMGGEWNQFDVVVVDKDMFYHLLDEQGFVQLGEHKNDAP